MSDTLQLVVATPDNSTSKKPINVSMRFFIVECRERRRQAEAYRTFVERFRCQLFHV